MSDDYARGLERIDQIHTDLTGVWETIWREGSMSEADLLGLEHMGDVARSLQLLEWLELARSEQTPGGRVWRAVN